MSAEFPVNLPSPIYNHFNRLKAMGHFENDQDLMQAALEALDKEWEHGNPVEYHRRLSTQPYMSRPGLSPDDYDT